MNMDTTVTAAEPLVTEHLWALSPTACLGLALAVGGILLFIISIATVRSDASFETLALGGIAGVALVAVGFVVVAAEGEDGGMELDANRVNEVISEQYRVTAIETAAEDGDGKPTAAQLCEPVSTKSPEYIGVTDGQQIRFKAGSTNCTSSNPTIAIIVTDTPGTALSADDLRKRNPRQEP